jgi:hypothetical protein
VMKDIITRMTIEEKLVRDIDTLRDSIRLNKDDLAKGLVSAPGVIEHGKWCREELDSLLRQLEQVQKDSHSEH